MENVLTPSDENDSCPSVDVVDSSQLSEIEMILPTNDDSDADEEQICNMTDIVSTGSPCNEIEAELEEEYIKDFEEKNLLLEIPRLSTSDVSSSKSSNCSSLIQHYVCDLCGRYVSSLGKLERHLKMAHMIPKHKFLCHFCDKKFIHYWFYKNHLKNNHNGVEMIFSCQICNKRWHSQRKLEEHKLNAHAVIYPFKCSHCDLAFKEIEILRSHLIEFHNDSKEADSARFNIDYLKQEEDQPNCPDDNFPCRYCKKRFNNENERDVHIIFEHRGITSCHTCKRKKPYACEADLLKHVIESQHELTRCSFCTMRFKTTAILVQHWEDQHSEIGRHSFYCESCGLRFVTFNKLSDHYTVHISPAVPEKKQNVSGIDIDPTIKKKFNTSTQQKPSAQNDDDGKLKCAYCRASFAVRTNLYNHVRKIHPEGANKFLPYKCDQCEKNFPSLRGLTAHTRIHLAENTEIPPINGYIIL